MKKRILLIACLVTSCFASDVLAQSSYVSFNVGYGLPMNAQSLESIDFNSTTENGTATTYEEEKVSLGKGLRATAAFGRMFTPYIGAEISVSYLMGGKSEAIQRDDNSNYYNKLTLSSSMISATPTIIFSAGLEKINPYAKIGFIVGSSTIKYAGDADNDGDIDKFEYKLNGGLAMGFSSSIGATYPLNEKMSLFGELNIISLSYAPTKGELVKASSDGQDLLPGATVSQKEIDFVDSYTYDNQNPPSDDKPAQELKQYFSYGSIGINFGLKISF
ncbi:MAG: outer membrane beta-barrel protein [Chryseolinea sp.]